MKLNTPVKAIIALFSSAIFLVPIAALANRFIDQVGVKLLGAALALGIDDYEPSHEPYVGKLYDDSKESVIFELREGNTYKIVGVSDQDCRDLDLRLYDQNGYLIDSDLEFDEYPLVSVTPRRSGPFELEVRMPSCSAAYCYYGIGAFHQVD